ncbi:MAG TPA: O-antigen polymerase [Clostridium sp.]|nr:O-antigen polymerase [Clostridium sp.]
MTSQINNKIKVLLLISILAIIMGVFNGNYIIPVMFILTLVVGSYFVNNEIYDTLYMVLLVASFYDYALYVPRVSSAYMFHIVLGIFSLLSIYKLIKDKTIFEKIDKKIIIIYIIWFIYMCLSITWCLSKSLSIKYIAIYLMMFAFIGNIMIYNISKERMEKTFKIVLFLISLITIIGFIEVLLGKQLPIKHYADAFMEYLPQKDQNQINARPMAFSFNPNNLAATLAILMPFCYYAVYKMKSIIAKLWFTVISGMSFILIGTTTSRTGYVAAVIGIVIYCLYSICNVRRLGVKNLIFPVILAICLALSYNYSYLVMNVKPVEGKTVVQNGLADKMSTLEEQEITVGGEGSLNVRVTIIQDVVKGIVNEHRYQGYGVGNVEQFIKDQGNTGNIYSPHCYAIEILGDFGVFGILLYGIYYLYLVIQNLILAIKNKSVECFAAFTGLMIFAPASFGPSSITYVFSYWLLVALSISTIQVYKNR